MHLSFFANDFIRSFSTKRVSVVLGRLTDFTPFAFFAEKLWTRQAFFRALLEFLRVRGMALRKLSLSARILTKPDTLHWDRRGTIAPNQSKTLDSILPLPRPSRFTDCFRLSLRTTMYSGRSNLKPSPMVAELMISVLGRVRRLAHSGAGPAFRRLHPISASQCAPHCNILDSRQ